MGHKISPAELKEMLAKGATIGKPAMPELKKPRRKAWGSVKRDTSVWQGQMQALPGVFIPSMKLVGSANERGRWFAGAKRAKTQRYAAYVIMLSQPKPVLPCCITVTRYGPVTLDTDNAMISAKHVRDGLADWLGVDDRDARITWAVKQERSPQGCYGVRIEIET